MFAGQYNYLFSFSVFVIGLTAFIALNMSCVLLVVQIIQKNCEHSMTGCTATAVV